MPIVDNLKNLFKRKPKPLPAPAEEPERLYSPPERGPADPGVPDFNVGDDVEARGGAQSGAIAVADERRRQLKAPVHIKDGTPGVVRGVDRDIIFVTVPLAVDVANWRVVRGTEEAPLAPGVRMKAVGSVEALDQNATIPAGSVGVVQQVKDDETVVVGVLFQFPKADWWNLSNPGERHWGDREAARGVKRDPREVMREVQEALDAGLLKPKYRKLVEECGAHPHTGHCYASSEAVHHLLGGAASGYKPTFQRVGEEPHWYLRNEAGEVLDPTSAQFADPVDYSQGKGKGWLTGNVPSQRAYEIIRRVRRNRRKPAMITIAVVAPKKAADERPWPGTWVTPEGDEHNVDYEHASWAHAYSIDNDIPIVPKDDYEDPGRASQRQLIERGWIRSSGPTGIQALPIAGFDRVLSVAKSNAQDLDVGDVVYVDVSLDYSRTVGLRITRPGQFNSKDVAVLRNFFKKDARKADVISRDKGTTVAYDVIPQAPSGYYLPTTGERLVASNYKRETVPVSKLVTTQMYAIEEKIPGAMEGLAKGELPQLVPQPNGTFLVDDGNHRVSKQIMDGATSIEALVFRPPARSAGWIEITAQADAGAAPVAGRIYESPKGARFSFVAPDGQVLGGPSDGAPIQVIDVDTDTVTISYTSLSGKMRTEIVTRASWNNAVTKGLAEKARKKRDQGGRYDFENQDAGCVCGHELGMHTDIAPHECIWNDFNDGPVCLCNKFRKSRKRAPKKAWIEITEVKTAEFQHPPRSPLTYFSKLVPDKLKAYEQAAAAAAAALKALPEDVARDANIDEYAVGVLSRGKVVKNVTTSLQDGINNKDSGHMWREMLRYAVQFAHHALTDEYSDLRRIERFAKEIDATELQRAITDYNEYAMKYGDPVANPNAVAVVVAWQQEAEKLRGTLEDFMKKTEEYLTVRYDEKPPKSEAIEVLYHASANARQLASSGFSAEPPESGGIGGSQSTKDFNVKGVSFTSDPYVALQIARSLKEVIGIAKGEYDWYDVLRWASAEDMDTAKLEAMAHSTFTKKRDIPQEHRSKDPKEWTNRAEPQKNDPDNVFGLYRAYLSMSPKRYDPLYFNVSINTFKKMDVDNVGVIKARVNMQDPNMLYASAMHEYRVPPTAIIGIDGLISERSARRADGGSGDPVGNEPGTIEVEAGLGKWMLPGLLGVGLAGPALQHMLPKQPGGGSSRVERSEGVETGPVKPNQDYLFNDKGEQVPRWEVPSELKAWAHEVATEIRKSGKIPKPGPAILDAVSRHDTRGWLYNGLSPQAKNTFLQELDKAMRANKPRDFIEVSPHKGRWIEVGARTATITRGYKVMMVEDGMLVSGANKNIPPFPAQPGTVMRMPGNGIYMSPNRDFVLQYYSGLADHEALVTFEFELDDITLGNLTDRESEIAVPEATIVAVEMLEDDNRQANHTAATKKPPRATLAALHNLKPAALLHAQEVGGLMAPSIAITKPDLPFDNFGDITLVAPMDMVDPATTPVFDADIYSPRYPTVRYKPQHKQIEKFRKEHKDYIDRTESYYGDLDYDIEKGGHESVINQRLKAPALQLAFLEKVKGKKFTPPMRDKPVENDWVRAPTMQKFFTERGIDHDARPGDPYWNELSNAARQSITEHFQSKELPEGFDEADRAHLTELHSDIFDPDDGQIQWGPADKTFRSHKNIGQTELDKYTFHDQLAEAIKPFQAEYEAWAKSVLKPTEGPRYLPTDSSRNLAYNPDNVLKLMTRKLKGGENFNMGLGSVRAKGANKFRSLEHMQQSADKLVSQEEFDKHKETNEARFFELVDDLKPYHADPGGFRVIDAVASAIGESYTRGRSLAMELHKDGFTGVPHELVRELDEFRRALVQTPTQYFEAKPQRIVGLNEFIGAVVPKDLSPEARAVLEANGLRVETYNSKNPATRQKAIKKIMKPARAKKAWIEVDGGARTAAGMIDLMPLADKISAALAEAARVVIEEEGELSPAITAAKAYETLGRGQWPLTLARLGDTALKTPKATALFANTKLYFNDSGSAAGSYTPPDYDSGREHGIIQINVEDALAAFEVNNATYAALVSTFRSTVIHELRHAADWAYRTSGGVGDWGGSNSDATDAEYFNDNRELLAIPGNVAEAVWRVAGEDTLRMNGEELSKLINTVAPSVMRMTDPKNRKKVMNILKPENRANFLRRVRKALEQYATHHGTDNEEPVTPEYVADWLLSEYGKYWAPRLDGKDLAEALPKNFYSAIKVPQRATFLQEVRRLLNEWTDEERAAGGERRASDRAASRVQCEDDANKAHELDLSEVRTGDRARFDKGWPVDVGEDRAAEESAGGRGRGSRSGTVRAGEIGTITEVKLDKGLLDIAVTGARTRDGTVEVGIVNLTLDPRHVTLLLNQNDPRLHS